MNSKLVLSIWLILFCVFSCKTQSEENDSAYLAEKKNFHSNFTRNIKAPQEYNSIENVDEIAGIEYPSDNLKLKAFIVKRNIDSTKRKPVLVYLHGGFALGEGDLLDCEVFTKQGYIVFAPTYRGENGNDGFFEFFLGEVQDAKQAIKWIGKQIFADSTKIYVFGHSIGGGISSLLSLEKDVSIAKSGSCGGLYTREFFYAWDDIIPFDKQNRVEEKMRLLLENLSSMQMKHYAFIGTEDNAFYLRKNDYDLMSKNTKLKIFYISGNHFTSLEPSMKAFINIINSKEEL